MIHMFIYSIIINIFKFYLELVVCRICLLTGSFLFSRHKEKKTSILKVYNLEKNILSIF